MLTVYYLHKAKAIILNIKHLKMILYINIERKNVSNKTSIKSIKLFSHIMFKIVVFDYFHRFKIIYR